MRHPHISCSLENLQSDRWHQIADSQNSDKCEINVVIEDSCLDVMPFDRNLQFITAQEVAAVNRD